MEKFHIYINEKEYEVRTPELKGQGNIEFSVFHEDNLLFKLSPNLNNNKIFWASTVNYNSEKFSSKYIKSTGKAIEKHYLNLDI